MGDKYPARKANKTAPGSNPSKHAYPARKANETGSRSDETKHNR